MKKFLSIILSLVMVFSLSATAFATSSNEDTLLELNTEVGQIKLTYTEDAAGNISMFEYRDNALYVKTKYTPGNTYYERLDATQSQSRSIQSNWEVVDFSNSITELPPPIMLFADNTRHIGYMHYNNVYTGQILSIKCHVDEWYNSGKKVLVSGTYGTLVDLATFIVGGIGLPAAIGSGVAAALLYAGVVAWVGGVLKTAVSTEVTANVIDQRIYGVCTSHSGKPTGDLGDAKIIYVTSNNSSYAGETFYEGYTTHMWGTGELGRMMFWKVFGVEYTPTSWTGVSS